MDARDSRQRTKLPVWGTLGAAYATVFGHPGDLLALAAVPLAICIAGGAFILFDPAGVIAWLAEAHGPGAAEGLRLLIGFLTTFIPWLAFVVAWHRFLLLGKRDMRGPVEFYFGARRRSVHKNGLFQGGLAAGAAIVFVFVFLFVIDFPLGYHEERLSFDLFSLILMVAVCSRLSFQNPAMAIGCNADIPTAWRQSRGVGWRLFWILLLAPLPLALLDALIGSPAVSPSFTAMVVEPLMLFLGTAAIIAALCLSYQRVVDASDRGTETPTSASDWMTGLVFPIVLGLVLGWVAASAAEFLDLPEREQVLLVAVAFLGPLLVKIYQFASTPSEKQGDTGAP